MNYEMKNGHILVKKIEPPKTIGDVVTTTDRQAKSFRYEVVCGNLEYVSGDIVIASMYAIDELEINNNKYQILDVNGIWAKERRGAPCL